MSALKPEEWYRHLDLAQRYLNATPNRSTGTSPFDLLFGTHIKFKENQSIRETIEQEWVTTFQEDRDDLRRRAQEGISKVQQENRRSFNKRRTEAMQYKEGDLVAIRRTQYAPGLKFNAKFLGPYEVKRILRNNRYLVQKIGESAGLYSTSTGAEYMKPWYDGDIDGDLTTDEEDESHLRTDGHV